MKQHVLRFLISLIIILSICLGCTGESADNIEEVNQIEDGHTFAVLLPSDDGYKSLLTEGEDNVPLQDALDVFISIAEDMGNYITLQGSTKDNNLSTLRYRTIDGTGSVNWATMPQTGNDATLSCTIGLLKKEAYSTYDRLIIISGHLSQTSLESKQAINTDVPTYLFQLSSFGDDNALLSKYAAIADLKIKEPLKVTPNGFTVYSATKETKEKSIQTEISFKPYAAYRGDLFLNELLTETIFDGTILNQSDNFELPSSLINEMYLVVTGQDLSNLTLISPDGTRYLLGDNGEATGTILPVKTLSFGDRQLKLVSLKRIITSGTWQIDNNGQENTSRLFYTFKSNVQEMIQTAPIVDENGVAYSKGDVIFNASRNETIKELFAIYPALRLRVTDTINNTRKGEETASDETPDQVKIRFTEGGDHEIIFRLMNGEEEIHKQVISAKIQDQQPVFNRQDGEEFTVHPDTGDEMIWFVKDWFFDPDGDEITITKQGGDTKRIKLTEDEQLILSLDNETDADGSEEVTLIAKSDTGNAVGTVRINWRYLQPKLEKLKTKTCVIVPVNDNDPLEKRSSVMLEAVINNSLCDERDKDQLRQQLSSCDAVVLDQEGTKVADASFDDWVFRSEPFDLPDVKGEYHWTLQLKSKEGNQPEWSLLKDSDKIKITNHAPESNEIAALENVSGEHYLFDSQDWMLQIPEKLFTDADNDPLSYTLDIEKDGNTVNNITINAGEDAEPIHMGDFGNYTLRINAFDNEDLHAAKEIEMKISLIDLKESLESLKYKLFAEPEKDQYEKKENIKLSLKFDKSGWNERSEKAYTQWLSSCDAKVLMDGNPLEDVEIKYHEDDQIFTAEVETPDHEKEYAYQIVLNSKPGIEPEITIGDKATVTLKVANNIPVFDEDKGPGNIIKWISKAEEETVTLPEEIIIDKDKDIINRHLIVYRQDKPDQPYLDTDISLPYTISFEPFSFFQLKNTYDVTVTITDNDNGASEYRIRIDLKNKQLLFIIIGAIVLLLLIIAAIVLYMIHRKKLPEFDGNIYFIFNGNKVSPDIDLKPWGKQKSIPVTIFAGSISILLNESQWEDMTSLELRPDKKEGFGLYLLKGKKPETLPYTMSDGLELRTTRMKNHTEKNKT